MQVAEHGDLQDYLYKNFDNMKWHDDKLLILSNIANGLRIIHENGFNHRNIHCRNILIGNNGMTYITDFGSSSNNKDSITQKICGSVPFIAPEALTENHFTPKSDIYSFGFIMWMISSGVIPYHYRKYDEDLKQSILLKGMRPPILKGTPSCFVKLMEQCWDIDPEKRPTSSKIYEIICSWYYFKDYKDFKECEITSLSQNIQDITQEIELVIKRNTAPKPPPSSKVVEHSSGKDSSYTTIGQIQT
ncbi:kinase-like domain-containing protein [Gigaspora rosea]|uniref:Kinase-like domain-containing protein n=1 Tax=Gigaspora rosea TaxID=44941 RepID=A0A397VSJ7_9GLOM|nr:kinase-like domain-containing protein [Gigaspora rosea]